MEVPAEHVMDLSMKIVAGMAVAISTVFGWMWVRMNKHEAALEAQRRHGNEDMKQLNEKLGEIQQSILTQSMEMHRDFVTKVELRDIVNSAVTPVGAQLRHVENQLDKLIERHIVEVRAPLPGSTNKS